MPLTYEEVLEYLADREGDPVTISSYPTFRIDASVPTLLGLQVTTHVGTVQAVDSSDERWLAGQAGARVTFVGEVAGHHDGLVLTREWFASAELSRGHSHLTIVVRASPDSPPLYPPVGQERPEDELRDVYGHELVGWGFAFDFDGDPPFSCRWAMHEKVAK